MLFPREMSCLTTSKDSRKALDLCSRDFLVGFIEYYELFGTLVCSTNESNSAGADVGEPVKKSYFICEER